MGESGGKRRHPPHHGRLSGTPVPDSRAWAPALLAETASESREPHFESRHGCPIMPCTAPASRPRRPSRAARKRRLPARTCDGTLRARQPRASPPRLGPKAPTRSSPAPVHFLFFFLNFVLSHFIFKGASGKIIKAFMVYVIEQ